MQTRTPVRKPLGVRVTAQQHRLLKQAASQEHRSVSSFVLLAALDAAQKATTSHRTQMTVDEAIARAQEMMRPFHREGHSLADELSADRRAEAARE